MLQHNLPQGGQMGGLPCWGCSKQVPMWSQSLRGCRPWQRQCWGHSHLLLITTRTRAGELECS